MRFPVIPSRILHRARSSRLGRFARANEAVAAVEFALIAPPFLALLLAILQVGLVFVAQQVLQTATSQAARLIMTGQAQNSNMTAAQFQQNVCNYATGLFNCAGIYVNVQTFATFGGVSMTNPVSNGNFNAGAMQYSTGGSGDIVVVQAFYQWPVYLAPLNFNLSNVGGSYDLIVGTAAFRTEPY
ncbi:MAG: pilus assembly protein [Alphaproteobacteria bacterium]|nr:pilus assembly protein [Alphaproteobacteria bacterium]